LLKTNKTILEIIQALANVIPFLVFFAAMANYVLTSTIAFPIYPILTVLMYCGSFAQLVMYIMVYHILHQPLSCYTHTSIWLTVFLSLYTHYGHYLVEDPVQRLQGETAMLLIFSAYATISMISYFQSVSDIIMRC